MTKFMLTLTGTSIGEEKVVEANGFEIKDDFITFWTEGQQIFAIDKKHVQGIERIEAH